MTKLYQKRIFILLGLTIGFFSSCNCHRNTSKDPHPTDKRAPSPLKDEMNKEETTASVKTTTASPSPASSNPVEEESSPKNLPDKEDIPIDSSTAEITEEEDDDSSFAATLKRLDDKIEKEKDEDEARIAELRKETAELRKETAELEKNKINSVKMMLEDKIPINDIMKFTRFSREEIKEIGISIGIDIDTDINKENKSF
jgi:hypothetical protein